MEWGLVLASLATLVVTAAALQAWNGWLALRRRELELQMRPHAPEPGNTGIAARIELADLRERVRRLEAIASGVDL